VSGRLKESQAHLAEIQDISGMGGRERVLGPALRADVDSSPCLIPEIEMS
jgi:hypothetical protein